MSDDLVLVTGGTGFLGAHTVVRLIRAGYPVRTTIRNISAVDRFRSMLRAGGVDANAAAAVEVVEADLVADAGWQAAVNGARYVLHVASPYPAVAPRNPDELLIPARDGSLRVLRAAREAGVRRVVLTSSFAAIGYGHPPMERTFTERDWTDPTRPGVEAYQRSKAIAEREAWDFVAREGGSLELSVINPVAMIGPMLATPPSTSMQLMAQILNRAMPALPRLSYGIVDVRDAADLHLLAMTTPTAGGERFLATGGDAVWLTDIARVFRDHLGDAGRRVPLHAMPDTVLRALALVSPFVRPMTHDLGVMKHLDNTKSREMLGWRPRTTEETLIATGESLLRYGLIAHLDPARQRRAR